MKYYLILFISFVFLSGCYVYDNGNDPGAMSYQGYNTVSELNNIIPEYNNKSILISAKFNSSITYEYQIKECDIEFWDDIIIHINDSNLFNISHLNLLTDQKYEWRVRGSELERKGEWSEAKIIVNLSELANDYFKEENILYLSDFIYISINNLTWGDSWEVRYKIDGGDFILVEPTANYIFIDKISAVESIIYQIRETKGDLKSFWSKNCVLFRDNTYLNVNNIITENLEFVLGIGNEQPDTPDQNVILESGFAMGETEVSNTQFCTVINNYISELEITVSGLYSGDNIILSFNNVITFSQGFLTVPDNQENLPVVGVSWFGAQVFSEYLNRLEGWDIIIDLETMDVNLDKTGYRLPSESEWEYTARGDLLYLYPWGNVFDDTKLNSNGNGVIVCGNSNNTSFFSCYDMAGNVWEWCLDNYSGSGYLSQQDNGIKVIRGGSWREESNIFFNTSFRSYLGSDNTADNVGFRLLFHYGN